MVAGVALDMMDHIVAVSPGSTGGSPAFPFRFEAALWADVPLVQEYHGRWRMRNSQDQGQRQDQSQGQDQVKNKTGQRQDQGQRQHQGQMRRTRCPGRTLRVRSFLLPRCFWFKLRIWSAPTSWALKARVRKLLQPWCGPERNLYRTWFSRRSRPTSLMAAWFRSWLRANT